MPATENNEYYQILLAEDDAEDREIFQDALTDSGINARLATVTDGKELIIYLNESANNLPDIIFLDINMPCMDGKQCLKEIRKNKNFDRVPVIIFTTSNHPKDIEECFSRGASLYVTKPNGINILVKILQEIFSLNWQEHLLFPEMRRFVLKGNEFKI